MRTNQVFLFSMSLLAATLMSGCGDKSGSGSGAAMPQTEAAVNNASSEAKKALTEAADTVVDAAKTTVSGVSAKFVSMAKSQGDAILTSIGQDLSAKVTALTQSAGTNVAVKTNIESSLTALTTGNDKAALAPAFQLTQLGLTDSQAKLAKEVGNLASAFVVQRNFSTLPGGQGDVSTLVQSLREGQYTTALTPLKNIMNNASLTAAQKDLIGSLADKYAPALKQAAGAVQQGLQGLQGLQNGLSGTKK